MPMKEKCSEKGVDKTETSRQKSHFENSFPIITEIGYSYPLLFHTPFLYIFDYMRGSLSTGYLIIYYMPNDH